MKTLDIQPPLLPPLFSVTQITSSKSPVDKPTRIVYKGSLKFHAKGISHGMDGIFVFGIAGCRVHLAFYRGISMIIDDWLTIGAVLIAGAFCWWRFGIWGDK